MENVSSFQLSDKVGGWYASIACLPSKNIIYSAKIASYIPRSALEMPFVLLIFQKLRVGLLSRVSNL